MEWIHDFTGVDGPLVVDSRGVINDIRAESKRVSNMGRMQYRDIVFFVVYESV